MHSSTKFIITLAIVATSPFAVVAAQSVTPQDASSSPLYFANMDKNHDGSISRSEVPKELHDLRVHFDQYDTNKDHRLSVAEYSIYLKHLAAGGAGTCNSIQQNLKDPNCDAVTGLRDRDPYSRPDTRANISPPPPPPTSGH